MRAIVSVCHHFHSPSHARLSIRLHEHASVAVMFTFTVFEAFALGRFAPMLVLVTDAVWIGSVALAILSSRFHLRRGYGLIAS